MPWRGAELAQWDRVLEGGRGGNTILRYIRGTTGLCRWLCSPAIAPVEANQIPLQGVRDPVLRVATRADTLRLTRFAP
jgi:hypothetical protein